MKKQVDASSYTTSRDTTKPLPFCIEDGDGLVIPLNCDVRPQLEARRGEVLHRALQSDSETTTILRLTGMPDAQSENRLEKLIHVEQQR